jgi:23S rRNA pseudouridine955/2504/2580 synthase
MTQWKINLREENMPLHEALALRVPTAPTAFLRQLCKKHRVSVNDDTAEASRSIRTGEMITVKSSQRWLECIEKLPVKPEQILYEDTDSIVLNKPAGLAIHRAEGHEDNLLHRVQDFLALRKENFQVSPIHRLDIGTSGAVLFGKGRASISKLGQMMITGQFGKSYLALVSGKLTKPGELAGEVPAKGKSKEALTNYTPLASSGTYTLLELQLVTGRYHQIRYQLALSGHPIVGDTRYQGASINGLERPFLHCRQLTFPRLNDERIMTVKAPLSLDLKELLTTMHFTMEELDVSFI